MGKSASLTARWLAIALALHLGTAHALCLDPASGQSGCRVPLDLEVRRAEAIVIGRVLSEPGFCDQEREYILPLRHGGR